MITSSTDVFCLSELAPFPDHLLDSAVLYNYLYNYICVNLFYLIKTLSSFEHLNLLIVYTALEHNKSYYN